MRPESFIPKNPIKFLSALWAAICQPFALIGNPHIVVCAWCKKVLHSPKGAGAVSHGCCWLCFYREIGGSFWTPPKLSDFEMHESLFHTRPIQHDEIWSGQTIHKGLIRNGQIERQARDARLSLDSEQRAIIGTVREVAREFGYSWVGIHDTEMMGWKSLDRNTNLP